MNTRFVESWEEATKEIKKQTMIKFTEAFRTMTDVDAVFEAANSLRQVQISTRGKKFEEMIMESFLQTLPPHLFVHYQVPVVEGVCREKRVIGKTHVVDFVVSTNPKISGESVTNHIVISAKTSGRERWKQDDFLKVYNPALYLYCCFEADFPGSEKFQESDSRKIISALKKKKDDRRFKLTFDHLINEILSVFPVPVEPSTNE
jgi:hypothetical protein